MDLAMTTKPNDLAAAEAQKALLQNQQALNAAQIAHREALITVASRSPFGRDMLRHLNAGKTIDQAFGLAATHYAKINAKAGLGPILSNINKFASDFGLNFPREKLATLRKNVEHVVSRERDAGRQLN
jgi:hypothetical protein